MSIVPKGFFYNDSLKNAVVTGNSEQWVSLSPNGPLTYGPSQDIVIPVTSQNQFANLNTAYLKYDIKFTKATPATAITVMTSSRYGLGTVIGRARTSLNNLDVEDLTQYNTELALDYLTASSERQAVLQSLEFYGLNVLNSTTDSVTVIHYLNSDFHKSVEHLPLPFVNLNLIFTTAPINEILYATDTITNNVTSYTISNVSYNVKMSMPNPLFLAQIFQNIESGMKMKLNYKERQRFRIVGNGSQRLQATLSTGQCQSLRQIKAVMKNVRSAASAGGFYLSDHFNHSHSNLSSWEIIPSNGSKLPIGRAWVRQEAIPMMLSQNSNPADPDITLNVTNWGVLAAAASSFDYQLNYNFKPSMVDKGESKMISFDGLEVTNGVVMLNLEFSEVFPSTSDLVVFCDIDSVISIGHGTVQKSVFA